MSIQNFDMENGLKLNHDWIQKLSIKELHYTKNCTYSYLTIETVPHATCLFYTWSHNLSAKQGDEANLNKAIGDNSLLSVPQVAFLVTQTHYQPKSVFETCVIPTLHVRGRIVDTWWRMPEAAWTFSSRDRKMNTQTLQVSLRTGCANWPLTAICNRKGVDPQDLLTYTICSHPQILESIAISTFTILASQYVQ